MTDQIHDAVRRHYENALADASCCGPSDCGCDTGFYDAALTADLPADVAGLSFGCGDPVTIAGLRPGETVLDLGSGAGLDCFLAARQVGPEGRVIGVDMTPAMLEKAEANRAKLGATNVEFRQGQIEALPVAGDGVDVIMSNCVINLSPDKEAVFREAYRVLRPGGRISVSDIVTEGAFTAGQRAQIDLWASCVTGAIDAADYVGAMERAGFVDVEVHDKVEAAPPSNGSPRIFSARITGRKPAGPEV
jgi:arsenite methyltransferase